MNRRNNNSKNKKAVGNRGARKGLKDMTSTGRIDRAMLRRDDFGSSPVFSTRQTTIPSGSSFSSNNTALVNYNSSYGTLFMGTGATADSFFSFIFQAADLSQMVNWTAVYDQYRIDKVSLDMIPSVKGAFITTSAGGATGQLPMLQTVVDFDDNVLLTSTVAATSYENYIIHGPGETITRTFKPAIAVQIYEGVATTGYSTQFGKWLDTSDPTIPHYGVKGTIPYYGSTPFALTWVVRATYHISFRSVR
jgi:hypothetical protein